MQLNTPHWSGRTLYASTGPRDGQNVQYLFVSPATLRRKEFSPQVGNDL